MKKEGVQIASIIVSMVTNIIFIVFIILSFFDIKSIFTFGSKDYDIKSLLEKKKNDVTEEVYQYYYNEYVVNHRPLDQFDKRHFEYVINLPFKKSQEENCDIEKIKNFLDKNFFGLNQAKEKIISYLKIKKFNLKTGKNLLLYGCPGNGKTSFAKAIAEAMNRKFITISLSGVDDSRIFLGSSKTYLGAEPGQLINEIKKSGCNNPVILLDEIDKFNKLKGGADVINALLYILDPVSNKNFRDHYVNFSFDLSHVFFIATANDFDKISSPLRDRFECLKIDNYSSNDMNSIFDQVIGPKLIKKINDMNDNKFLDIKFEKNLFKETFKKCIKTTISSCYRITNRDIERVATEILTYFLYNYHQIDHTISKKNEYVKRVIDDLESKKKC